MAPPKVAKPRPYRDFLTPALHRQFVHASLLSLGICYVAALLMGQINSLWVLSPFGFTGARSLLLFVCSLLVFIIRVGGQNVGEPTTSHPLESIQKSLLSATPYVTLVSYFISAWLFGETYAWSYSGDYKLGMVHPGGYNHHPQMNERAIFFRSLFPVLACIQAFQHLFSNLNQLQLPYDKLSQKEPKRVSQAVSAQDATRIVLNAAGKSFMATVVGTILYRMVYRHVLWNVWYKSLRNFYGFRGNYGPKGSGPEAWLRADIQFLYAGFLLSFLWEFSNLAYSEYIAEQPLKRGKPLTNDSRDPNGSLLSGLRAKRQFAKTMAFWELSLISNRFEDRRKTFYTENDRAGGSTWSQLHSLCVGELSAINSRIIAYKTAGRPTAPPTPAVPQPHQASIDKNVKQENVYSPGPKTTYDKLTYTGLTQHKLNEFIRSQGSNPGATNPPAKLVEMGAQKLLTDGQRSALEPQAIRKSAGGIVGQLLASPIGQMFRKTFDRRVTGVICGTPTSRSSILIDAVNSIAALAVHSIKEDRFGSVQGDLPTLTRTIADTIRKVWGFVDTASPHWTDVKFQPEDRDDLPEIEAVSAALVKALEDIVREFGEFFDALGISKGESKEWLDLMAKAKTRETAKTQRRLARETARVHPVRQPQRVLSGTSSRVASSTTTRGTLRPQIQQGQRRSARRSSREPARPSTPEMQQVGVQA